MTVSLKKWINPKNEADVRVYVNVWHEWSSSEMIDGNGVYFTPAADPARIAAHYRTSHDGRYGYAAFAIMDHFQIKDCSFAELLARMAACQTKGGNFSEVRYFKDLRERVAA